MCNRKWGHNVDDAFYAQHQLEALDMNNTIINEMKEAGAQKTELELRTLLGCFLFSGDDADKKIKVLSGGEKARVALAKTILSKANFLLLDEPTNHLDIHSTELLIDALNRYGGSYILVSHDRYFISKTANKIWEIVDHEIKEFKGGYEEYVAWKERMAGSKNQGQSNTQKSQGTTKNEPVKPAATKDNKPTSSDTVKPPSSAASAIRKELQQQQKKFSELEKKLAILNQKKADLEGRLSHPDTYSNATEFKKTETSYKEVIQELAAENSRYELVFEKIMDLENQFGG